MSHNEQPPTFSKLVPLFHLRRQKIFYRKCGEAQLCAAAAETDFLWKWHKANIFAKTSQQHSLRSYSSTTTYVQPPILWLKRKSLTLSSSSLYAFGVRYLALQPELEDHLEQGLPC